VSGEHGNVWSNVPAQVTRIVAEALDVAIDRVVPHASLIDDLGAESIDFLDILFRVETAFGIQVRENEMWEGSVDRTSQASIDASIARLRARLPDFRWDRLPARVPEADLPRLITVQTIVDFLERRRQREARG
jgi:acyl carrier protein